MATPVLLSLTPKIRKPRRRHHGVTCCRSIRPPTISRKPPTTSVEAWSPTSPSTVLKVPVVLVRVAGASPQLVDGRHRLDLLEGTGIKVAGDDGGVLVQHQIVDVADDTEAERLSLSLNAHRRHLQADERRKLLRAQLIVTPEKSNRQVAKLTGFSHPHVAKVRTELEQAGDVETVSTSIDTKGRRQSIRKGTTSKASTKTRRRTEDDLKSDIAAKIAAVAPATPDEVVREVVAPDEEIELEGVRNLRPLCCPVGQLRSERP